MDDYMLGQLLIENKFITHAQLHAALEKQEFTQPHKRLGVILVEDGIVSKRAIDTIVHIQNQKRGKDAEDSQPSGDAAPPAAPAIDPAEIKRLEDRIDELENKMKKMKKLISDSLTDEMKRYVRQMVRRASKGK